jgi:hypothetical protein
MRGVVTWLALAFLGILTGVAIYDTLPLDAEPRAGGPSEPVPRAAEEPFPLCDREQLDLVIDVIEGTPAAVLRHVKGKPCRVDRWVVSVEIEARRGSGNLLGPEGDLAGNYYPGVETVVAFRYSPSCSDRGPFVATATAGPFKASRRIPVLLCGP